MSDETSPLDISEFKIVRDFPPNFAAIDAVFGITRKMRLGEIRNPLFCYGSTIFNPNGVALVKQTLVHESTHMRQQSAGGPEAWWDRYLVDPGFRFEQELEAHRNEYRQMMLDASNRHVRRFGKKDIVTRLAGPMYNHMITSARARQLIEAVEV